MTDSDAAPAPRRAFDAPGPPAFDPEPAPPGFTHGPPLATPEPLVFVLSPDAPVVAPIDPAPSRRTFVPDPNLDGKPASAVEPFAPPSDAWRRVSPKLTTVKRISASAWLLPPTIALPILIWFLVEPVRWAALAVAAVGLLWWLWLWIRARRVVAAYGWARRDNDLCVVSGLMFKSLTIVPFGRMQTIKVTAGPLLRAFGLANVEFITASAAANASAPGLPADEARELRDLIIELSDAEGSGL